MKDFDQLLEEHSQEKSKLEEINLNLKKNNTEIQNLKQRASEAKQEHVDINNRLQSADKDLATGELTTDGFLSIKEGFYGKESKLNALNDAVKAQEKAREHILSSRTFQSQTLSGLKRRVALKISEELFSELSKQEKLKDLFHAYRAAKESRVLMNEPKVDSCRMFGEKLMRAVFLNEDADRVQIPDGRESRDRIDEIIIARS